MPKKTDYQVCQKCGTVFARRDTDGPGFTMMDIYDHSTMCTKCGGNVVWQSSPEIGSGCLPTLLLLSFLAGLVIFWLK